MKDAYVMAAGLSLATRTGPVFADLDFALPKGRLSLVVGRSGTGRSALLLALAGRMRGLTGTLRVAGFDAATQSKQVRANVAVARIARLVDLEGQLTVSDCITERALTDAVKPARATGVFAHAEEILDHTFDRTQLVDELPALDRTLLSVALATLRPAHVLVLDDADRGLTSDEIVALLGALDRLAETGVTVIASVLDAGAAPDTATVVPLQHPHTAHHDTATGPDHADRAESTEAEADDEAETDHSGDNTAPEDRTPLANDTEVDEKPHPGDEAQLEHGAELVDQHSDVEPLQRRSRSNLTPTTPPSPASPATPSTV